MNAIVFGNITLDVLCFPVENVPRYESTAFEKGNVSPGGCGSNTAIGLCALNVPTALVGRIGNDDAAWLVKNTWDRIGLDQRFIIRDSDNHTGISVGLVDRLAQPRFVHTPGVNANLTVDDLDLGALKSAGAKWLHVAGFFVLPGLLDGRLPAALAEAKRAGMTTSLDVVRSPRMDTPEYLWPCLPHLDYFLCNREEAKKITGEGEILNAVKSLRERGAASVIAKLGVQGCWVESEHYSQQVPCFRVKAVDTTGAGDAFAAGLIAGTLSGSDLLSACEQANRAGALVTSEFGCVAYWMKRVPPQN